MTFDPVLPMPVLGLLSAVSTLLLACLVWKGSGGLTAINRVLISVVYIAANLAIFTFLANPGTSVSIKTAESPVFLVLADKSSSMNVPDGNAEKASRDSVASAIAALPSGLKPDNMELDYGILNDAFSPSDTLKSQQGTQADGKHSNLTQGVLQAINHYRSSGRMLAGVLLLSDGRETSAQSTSTLVRVANSHGTPIHTALIGGDWANPDVDVQAVRSLVSGFSGSNVTLGAKIRNTGMGPLSLPVLLMDEKQDIIERKNIEIRDGQSVLVQFTVKCEDKPREYSIGIPRLEGEKNNRNNAAPVSLRIMSTPIRVFMAEGAPYWDSKFLAQLLRRQPIFNVKSVHRLTDDRYFQLNTQDDSSNATELDGGLPTTLEDFRQFDMIILGKGMEHLMTPERAHALQAYVRDLGGLLVFARGKSYGGDFPELAVMEPFTWKNMTHEEHRFLPSTEGELDNLFGQLLPGKNEPVWESLPPLSDVWDIDQMKPFTRILARSGDQKTPLLAVRRIGLGAVVMINGDGMWKWDFYPEAKRWGNCYEDFWTQFLQWTQTSSEFMPGYDLSLRAERSNVLPGQPVIYNISWRGSKQPENVTVGLYAPGEETPVAEQKASYEGISEGLPRWSGRLTAPKSGHYILRAHAGITPRTPNPEARIQVLFPPEEEDNLNADPAYLSALSEATGGRFLKPEEIGDALPDMMKAPESYEYTEEIFTPCWNQWHCLAAICTLLSLCWWVRRRHGLL